MAAAAILRNQKIAISRPWFERFRPNVAHWRSSTLFSHPTIKNLKFENPRWRQPPSWKIEKSPYFGRGLTDFNQIWQGDAVRPSWPFRPLKIWNLKNPRWRRPPSWKIEKSPYLGRVLTDYDQIWHGDAVWPSSADRPLQIWNLNSHHKVLVNLQASNKTVTHCN